MALCGKCFPPRRLGAVPPTPDTTKLSAAAFEAHEAMEQAKRDLDEATARRDASVMALMEVGGIGPFRHPQTGQPYQAIRRGPTYFLRPIPDGRPA